MGMNQEGMAPSQLYAQLVERLDYLEYLKQDDPEKAEERVENVQELSSMLQRYEEEAGEGASLSGFLEEVSLFTDIDNYDAGADSAVLMTIHSAKGLEFPVVFLPGWEEGVFPSGAVLYNPEEVEEERRLAYVAITRAREELYLYHAEKPHDFRAPPTATGCPVFAEEIPSELLERSQSRTWSKACAHRGGPSQCPRRRGETPAPVQAPPGEAHPRGHLPGRRHRET